MKDLIITTGDGEKGRSFRGSLLAYVEADALWEGGEADTDTRRPVWMMVACSEAEAAPFAANLRMGRSTEVIGGRKGYSRRNKGDRFELLRSAGYQFAMQRHPEGTVITAFLPDMFRIDPGMVDPDGCQFIVLPARAWLSAVDPATLAHVRRWHDRPELPELCSAATLFAAYLDRRTRAPLIPDVRFYAQMLVGAVDAGLATMSSGGGEWGRGRFGFAEEAVETVGLAPGVAFCAKHEELEAFLAEQVKLYHSALPAQKKG